MTRRQAEKSKKDAVVSAKRAENRKAERKRKSDFLACACMCVCLHLLSLSIDLIRFAKESQQKVREAKRGKS